MDRVDHRADHLAHLVRVLKGHENEPIGQCAGGGGRRTLGFVAADGAVFLA